MSNSSPAHSSVSVATSGGGGGGGGGLVGGSGAGGLVPDDNAAFHFPADLISAQDRKDEALLVLKSDLMAALNKEVKSLDEDNWMFAGPRSQIHLISRPGGSHTCLGRSNYVQEPEKDVRVPRSGLLNNQTETAKRWHSVQLK